MKVIAIVDCRPSQGYLREGTIIDVPDDFVTTKGVLEKVDDDEPASPKKKATPKKTEAGE